MRRFLLIYMLLLLVGQITVQAQVDPKNPYGDRKDQYGNIVDQYGNQIDPAMRPQNPDSSNVKIESLPPKLYMWHVSENLGNINRIPADTAYHLFQNSNLVEGPTGHYNYLGNLGSPRLSRIFFERREAEPTIFMEPFSSFFVRPNEFNFTNSNVPYTNLTYYKAGNKINGEERFKSYFSVNVNKRLAFGFSIDYLYGRGYYNSQNTSFFNAAIFGSYIGNHYEANLLYSNNYMKMNENGGIMDDKYITDPQAMASGGKTYEPQNIPTLLNKSANNNKDFYIFLTQRYKLGFQRELPKAEKDTLPAQKEFVPVTSFIHTIKLERARHRFTSQDNVKDYYDNNYIRPSLSAVNDSTTYLGIKNTFGIALLEGFNKYAKAGLTAFISHKLSNYYLMDKDSTSVDHYTENEAFVGAELSKREGKMLHYRALGEVGLLGEAIGQFRINGDADLQFHLWKDTVSLIVRASVSNTLPSFYLRHYHSKHFYWDNDNLEKEFRTRIDGEINIARWQTHLKAGVENIKHYTYLNPKALPQQNGGNIQVISATLGQNFRLGIFHLDNEVSWQKSSNQKVLPLPQLSLYHNLYLQTKLAKVLSVQLGADVRYFSKYQAPAYMPALQQFHLQPDKDQVEIGGYPIVNVYANLHLKRTRIFAMMYHVNQGSGSANSFLSPHYPINPRLFKIGISWNFYD
ncbi:MAG: putative porin [Bacteroides sp.]